MWHPIVWSALGLRYVQRAKVLQQEGRHRYLQCVVGNGILWDLQMPRAGRIAVHNLKIVQLSYSVIAGNRLICFISWRLGVRRS